MELFGKNSPNLGNSLYRVKTVVVLMNKQKEKNSILVNPKTKACFLSLVFIVRLFYMVEGFSMSIFKGEVEELTRALMRLLLDWLMQRINRAAEEAIRKLIIR